MDIHEELMRRKSLVRHSKLEGVAIPASTEDSLVIPCRVSYYGYILLKPEEGEDHFADLPPNRINDTLNRVNRDVEMLVVRKRKSDGKEFQHNRLFALRALFLLGTVIAFVMYVLVLYQVRDFKEKYILIMLIVVLGIVVASLVLAVQGLTTGQKSGKVDEQVGAAVDKVLEEENRLYYAARGYLFEREKRNIWLTLRRIN